MAKQTLSMSIRIEGIRELERAFRQLPKDATTEIKDASAKLAEGLVGKARSAAASDRAPQSRLIASTIRVRRGRTPAIVAGGSRGVGRRGTPAYKVLFGSEFGSNRYAQFKRPHAGQQGYWFFPLVDSEAQQIGQAWMRAAESVIKRFTKKAVV